MQGHNVNLIGQKSNNKLIQSDLLFNLDLDVIIIIILVKIKLKNNLEFLLTKDSEVRK